MIHKDQICRILYIKTLHNPHLFSTLTCFSFQSTKRRSLEQKDNLSLVAQDQMRAGSGNKITGLSTTAVGKENRHIHGTGTGGKLVPLKLGSASSCCLLEDAARGVSVRQRFRAHDANRGPGKGPGSSSSSSRDISSSFLPNSIITPSHTSLRLAQSLPSPLLSDGYAAKNDPASFLVLPQSFLNPQSSAAVTGRWC